MYETWRKKESERHRDWIDSKSVFKVERIKEVKYVNITQRVNLVLQELGVLNKVRAISARI